MWPFTSSDSCDTSCTATRPSIITLPFVFSLLLLTTTFTTFLHLSRRKFYPLVVPAPAPGCGVDPNTTRDDEGVEYFLPSHAPAELKGAHQAYFSSSSDTASATGVRGVVRRLLNPRGWRYGLGINGGDDGVEGVFAVTTALAMELGILLLADVSGVFDANARGLGMGSVVTGTMVMMVGVVPGVGIWGFFAGGRGSDFAAATVTTKGKERGLTGFVRRWWRWALWGVGFGIWLGVFWRVGGGMLPSHHHSSSASGGEGEAHDGDGTGRWWAWSPSKHQDEGYDGARNAVIRGCVARIGVLGIASLALLSGFACVSTAWTAFGCYICGLGRRTWRGGGAPGAGGKSTSGGSRWKEPSETDVARRQAGLDSATEMRVAKQNTLRGLLARKKSSMQVSPQQKQQQQQPGGAMPRSSTSSVSSASGLVERVSLAGDHHHHHPQQQGLHPATATSIAPSVASSTTNTHGHAATTAPATASSSTLGSLWTGLKTLIPTPLSDPSAHEIAALEMEISGLEDMELRLSTSLTSMREKLRERERRKSRWGRWVLVPWEYAFAGYCIYRVINALLIVIIGRLLLPLLPSLSSSSSLMSGPGSSIWGSGTTATDAVDDETLGSVDPLAGFLAMSTIRLGLANAEEVDVAAWGRTCAFLLSGVLVIGGANSVVLTFRLFSQVLRGRASGRGSLGGGGMGLGRKGRGIVALTVAQIGGMYAVGSGVMMRGRISGSGSSSSYSSGDEWSLYGSSSPDVFSIFGNVGAGAGGTEKVWIDSWFQGWFAAGAVATAVGIWAAGVWSGGLEDWGEDGWDCEGGVGVGREKEWWEGRGGVELGWKRS